MAQVHNHIADKHRSFIDKQRIFFVASAPLDADGHINLSPKGTDCFRVLSPNQVAYMDLVGSGNETSAHLDENGRITFMFCAFDGSPSILRLYGKGRTVLPGQVGWDDLSKHFNIHINTRQIIVADITRLQTSCGFGVPLYDFVAERDLLFKWAEKTQEDGLEKFKKEYNLTSIDGLPTSLKKI